MTASFSCVILISCSGCARRPLPGAPCCFYQTSSGFSKCAKNSVRYQVGAEFLFQVIAERAERAAVIITTNLPFSEWPQVFPNLRLCKALLDRVTDRAHIVETGLESYRFRRTAAKRGKAGA
ncbi:MAG: ATP-binding protein [Terriglobales bacterium]